MRINFESLSKWQKRGIAFTSDLFMTVIALISAGWLTTNPESSQLGIITQIIILQGFIYWSCGLYRGVWRFASIPDILRILRALFISVIFLTLLVALEHFPFSKQMYVVYNLLLLVLLPSTRLFYRWSNDYSRHTKKGKRVLIVGAGEAGERLIRELIRSTLATQYCPVGFVDDKPTRQGAEIHGVRILGYCDAIPEIVKKYQIELVLIAMPSITTTRMRQIVSYCEQANVIFRTLPSLREIAAGSSKYALREVLLEDLLGREQIQLDWQAITQAIFKKNILVTGGGGSIGSELCRQISKLDPENIIIVDNNEFNLYTIDFDLRTKFPHVNIHTHLCSVTDKIELAKLFQQYRPEIVFHVAAYKHVPLLENHIRVAMFNNIIGTRITAELANEYQVKNFVLISTDKAVNPTNIMGATKRAAEVFCQTYNLQSKTQFTTVRFGNVLDSAGSVIPLFRKQLLEGGPLTVTHPDITRYFMTIPEASQLILQAITLTQTGEIFVLDMGEPVKISYLAEQLIKLAGKTKEVTISYIGLRPGEKLEEELFHQNEKIYPTSHPKLRRADVRIYEWNWLEKIMEELELACKFNQEPQLKILLRQLVPEYVGDSAKSSSLPAEDVSFV